MFKKTTQSRTNTSYVPEGPKQCYFCNNNFKKIDYKEIELLKRFVSPHARIIGKRKTATCSKHQRKLSAAVKRARMLSLLPFISR